MKACKVTNFETLHHQLILYHNNVAFHLVVFSLCSTVRIIWFLDDPWCPLLPTSPGFTVLDLRCPLLPASPGFNVLDLRCPNLPTCPGFNVLDLRCPLLPASPGFNVLDLRCPNLPTSPGFNVLDLRCPILPACPGFIVLDIRCPIKMIPWKTTQKQDLVPQNSGYPILRTFSSPMEHYGLTCRNHPSQNSMLY